MILNPALFIVGPGSGSGKTTIANGIHRELETCGWPVHCLYEIEVTRRREFAPFQRCFERGDPGMTAALRTAIDSYLARAVPRESVFLSESLFPFLRWLVLGNVDDSVIREYCLWLRERLAVREPVLVVLECARDVAVSRARAERGETWYRQWRERQRQYPLHRTQPGWDMWQVFEREETHFGSLDWPILRFDTDELALDRVISMLAEHLQLPTQDPFPLPPFQNGVYIDGHSPDPRLREIEICDGRLRMMGVWLELIARPDGSVRVANSNSTISVSGDAATLNSSRFGRVEFTRRSTLVY